MTGCAKDEIAGIEDALNGILVNRDRLDGELEDIIPLEEHSKNDSAKALA